MRPRHDDCRRAELPAPAINKRNEFLAAARGLAGRGG